MPQSANHDGRRQAAGGLQPLTLKAGAGSTRISLENAMLFFGPCSIASGERRGYATARGPWNIIVSYKALAVTATWRPGATHDYVDEYTLYGDRTMNAPRQSGYELEGWISIAGVKRSAFTSSIMFEVEETGQLVNVAVIHARTSAAAHPVHAHD
jgi:hypothetical protein